MFYLSACALIKNEGPYLQEWIEYHHMMGVEHFFLYDNLSVDDTRKVLYPYVQKGLVTLHSFEKVLTEPGVTVLDPAQNPFQRCIEEHRAASTWIAFLDLDEFIVLARQGWHLHTIPSLMWQQVEGKGDCLVLPWRTFGSCGHLVEPRGVLVMEAYRNARSDEGGPYWYVKSIVRPDSVQCWTSLHVPILKEGKTYCNELGKQWSAWNGVLYPGPEPPAYRHIYIHHYRNKSLQFYLQKKLGKLYSRDLLLELNVSRATAVRKMAVAPGFVDYACDLIAEWYPYDYPPWWDKLEDGLLIVCAEVRRRMGLPLLKAGSQLPRIVDFDALPGLLEEDDPLKSKPPLVILQHLLIQGKDDEVYSCTKSPEEAGFTKEVVSQLQQEVDPKQQRDESWLLWVWLKRQVSFVFYVPPSSTSDSPAAHENTSDSPAATT